MSIALASIIFFIYLDNNLHKSMILNDLLKRIKHVYIPSKQRDSDKLFFQNSKFDLTVKDIDENTRKIHIKPKKLNTQELKFN